MMKNYIVYIGFSLLAFLYATTDVKSQESCTETLAKARAAYDEGQVKEIEGMLRPCIKNGFDKIQREEAYRLIIRSKLFDEQTEEAEKILLEMLQIYPEYEIKDDDPQEFELLYDDFVTSPLWSAGLFAGLHYVMGRQLQEFGTYDTEEYDYSDFRDTSVLSSFHVGARINRYIVDRIEVQLDLMLEIDEYHYTVVRENNSLIQTENQTLLSFPLSFTYDFIDENRWRPYARLGANFSLLLGGSSDNILEYTDGSPNNDEDVSYNDLNEVRKNFQISALVGGGVKYKIPKAYVFADVRYRFGLNNLVEEGERLAEGTDEGNYNRVFGTRHIDGDFTLDKLSISVGIAFNFYKPRSKKEETE